MQCKSSWNGDFLHSNWYITRVNINLMWAELRPQPFYFGEICTVGGVMSQPFLLALKPQKKCNNVKQNIRNEGV